MLSAFSRIPNLTPSKRAKFDSKNYFYPDSPKAYQISQFDKPVSFDGQLTVTLKDGATKKIGITRAHLEEDAGKMIHDQVEDGSLVDYNRTGTPLLEIVSEPDMRTAEEAYAYLTKLKAILQYTGVSDCNMQEGSLRCDANVSLRPVGQEKFGTKTEVKNLNSFRAVFKSIEYEIKRQAEVLDGGGVITQETRLWNDVKGKTAVMRSKEEAHDYRYFPEPDLVPFTIARSEVDEARKNLPELPDARFARFQEAYSLSAYDASNLVADQALADYYEKAAVGVKDPKTVSNWLQSELVGILNEREETIETTSLKPEDLRSLIQLIEKGTISGKIAKDVLPEMVETGKAAEKIVEEKGLVQISDTGELEKIIEAVILNNEKVVSDFKSGKKTAIGFLVGQVMKQTKGKANPGVVNQLLEKKLS